MHCSPSQLVMSVLASGASLFLAPPTLAAEAIDPCTNILPSLLSNDGKEERDVTATDIARLRDIGHFNGFGADGVFDLSPDKSKMAFVITRGEPAANSYCQALIVASLEQPQTRAVLDVGHEIILPASYIRGLRTTSGALATVHPLWSPDGKWLAYLKGHDGRAQAWIVRSDGKIALPVSDPGADVVGLRWSEREVLLYRADTSLSNAENALKRESLAGYVYDERFVPNATSRPSLRGPPPTSHFAYHLNDHSLEVVPLATWEAAEKDRFDRPSGALLSARASNGAIAWTEPQKPGHFVTPIALWARRPDGLAVKCMDPACMGGQIGIEAMWWSPDNRDLVYIRRGGWGRGRLSLNRWRPGHVPTTIFETDDLLVGCQPLDRFLFCAREESSTPRRIVKIDMRSGDSQIVFDPNPEFRTKRLGAVERLHWTNQFGIQCYGDLVLPPGYKGGPLPLIVVQYYTRGFLRGGVGDEYPIFPFAANGFAVLSLQNPMPFYNTYIGMDWKTWEEAEVRNVENWNERRSILDSLDTAIDLLVGRGIVDPDRIGITGLSDGATTVQFALINSRHHFAAAAVSSAFMEPMSIQVYGGEAWAAQLLSLGFPGSGSAFEDSWKAFAVSRNTDHITTPVLMQVADAEYITALEGYSALKSAGIPTELYVFDNEFHNKWQPAHRLAIYQRNLKWFERWLRAGPGH